MDILQSLQAALESEGVKVNASKPGVLLVDGASPYEVEPKEGDWTAIHLTSDGSSILWSDTLDTGNEWQFSSVKECVDFFNELMREGYEGLSKYPQSPAQSAPEQPEEMGMHNPFESRLDTALEEGIGSAIGGGLGKAAGWAAGQLAAGAKGFVKGAGAAYKGVDAKPAAPAAPAAAKPGMAKPAAAKPVVAGKPAAKKAYEQEVYNKAISSSDEGEFLGNLRYFYNWAKSPQGKDRVVPRQLEKMMAYAVFKYLTNPSFTMSSAKDIMKNVSIPISGADFDGKPEPAGKPEAEAEKTPTPVSVKAPEKAEEPAKKEEPAKAEKPEAKKEPEKEEAKKESKDKNWDGWLSEVVADWV